MSDTLQTIEVESPGMPETITPAVAKAELDSMREAARERPRDERKVLRDSLAELDLADTKTDKGRPIYFYSIPFREWDPEKRRWRVTPVEGPSIHTAMSLARRWGNCRVAARITSEDVQGWTIEGTFIDLETGFGVLRPARALKWIRRKDGKVQQLPLDRQMLSLQKGVSIALRNAILGSLPSYFINAFVTKAKQLAAGNLDAPADPKIVAAAARVFLDKLSVPQAKLEEYVEAPAAKWTGEQVAQLRGLYAAIIDGQVTVDEVFGEGGEVPSEASEEKSAGPAKAERAVAEAGAKAATEVAPPIGPPPTGAERFRQ